MQSAGKGVVSQGKPLDLKVLKGLELEGDDVLMQPVLQGSHNSAAKAGPFPAAPLQMREKGRWV